ncbi:MAG: VWA domain-containing protein [Myxococcales bacterium]|nr:VWA domain-containing protein [Myxococcales bacterium]
MKPWMRRLLPLAWTLFFLVPAGYAAAYFVAGVYDVPLAEGSFRFEREWAALLFVAPLLLLGAHYVQGAQRPRLLVSRGRTLAGLKPGWRSWLEGSTTGLRVVAATLLVFALMGPQSIHARDRAEVEGIDIVLVLDLSRSMEAGDVQPNRFEALKQVTLDFLSRRPNDRIGAVVFGREAFTLMPLTTDKEALRTVIRELQLDLIDGRGTAIGNGVGTALNRLRRSNAKSKVIILVTDGDSNAGNVSPDQAAELAATMEVKIFSILMGVSDDAPVKQGTDFFGRPVFGMMNHPVNPELLQRMSDRTEGKFFPVSDRRGLERSFHSILDELEKTEIEDGGRVYGELFPAFVWPAISLLFLELLLGLGLLRRWP